MYFEKFVVRNAIYFAEKSGDNWWNGYGKIMDESSNMTQRIDAKEQYNKRFITKNFGFMYFNLAFTALIGLTGLMTIPHCFRMIKQGNTRTKLLYILTFVQILLQTAVPFLRAGLVINQVGYKPKEVLIDSKIDPLQNIQRCASVGFQVYFTFWSVICGQNIHIHIFVSDNVISIIHM